ncbi:MAG TPA: hypothetical protein DHV96_07995 [Lachnospiraceae bacterium]|nr:hypothetical protein [Lachnospiraceae bacterium]
MADRIDQMLYKKFNGDIFRYQNFIDGWNEMIVSVKKGAVKRGIDLKDIPIVGKDEKNDDKV